MKLPFVKMHGAGNDYIYFDGFARELPAPEALAERLSDRRLGVGGDGIVFILPSERADARMRMFNADGSESGMCGNAIRCVAKYLVDGGRARGGILRIDTKSGVKAVAIRSYTGGVMRCMVEMGEPILHAARIPAAFGADPVIGHRALFAGGEYEITCVSMGNPHCVIFVDDTAAVDLPMTGPAIEADPRFPDRVNVEFAQVMSDRELRVRVWERGSGETFACGTGACASAVAAMLRGHVPYGTETAVRMRGGTLLVQWNRDAPVRMTGPAQTVFTGEIEVDSFLRPSP